MISFDVYAERAKRFANEATQTETTIRQYAWIRLALVIAMAFMFYAALNQSFLFYGVALLLAAFIMLVRKQVALENYKQQLYALASLNEGEQQALRFEPLPFANGSAFINPHHPFSNDLDLFGDRSIFQYLNRSATEIGQRQLAHELIHRSEQPLAAAELRARQEAVRELATLLDFRQQAWATGQQMGSGSFNDRAFTAWLSDKPFVISNRLLTVSRYALPAVTLAVIAWSFIDPARIPFAIALMTLQLSITGSFAKRINTIGQQLSRGNKFLSNYAQLLKLFSQQSVTSELLKKHHAVASESHAHIQTFAALVNAFESRQNAIAMFFGNSLFQYDLHTLARLEVWRNQHGNEVDRWLTSLAEWDALLSPATLHYNFPEYAFAEVAGANQLEAKDLGHLLIPPAERVNNSIAVGKPATVWLITGANMAGKSTFLRALGVNFVLGNMGSPVCATHWRMPLIKLRTGMRTTDSLQDHQSYFFAELRRLQSIMTELRTGEPMFILLDEILKGTNSTDKQLGSRELLKQLKQLPALVVLATHDIALGDLEQQYPNEVANACFEGRITGDQLSFDYKLHAGVAQKANATFLMQTMGIIPRLTPDSSSASESH